MQIYSTVSYKMTSKYGLISDAIRSRVSSKTEQNATRIFTIYLYAIVINIVFKILFTSVKLNVDTINV